MGTLPAANILAAMAVSPTATNAAAPAATETVAAPAVLRTDEFLAVPDPSDRLARRVLGEAPSNEPVRKKNNFSKLIPDAVARMSPEDQVRMAEQLLDEMEKLRRRTIRAVRQLGREDWEGLHAIRETFTREENRLAALEPKLPEGAPHARWVDALFSSAQQIAIAALEETGDWDRMLRKIRPAAAHVHERILGQNGYQTSHARRELARTLTDWLFQNFPRRYWLHGKLQMRTSAGLVERGTGALIPAWPPKPDDPEIRRYLDVLRWGMETRTETNLFGKQEIVVTLDFGRGTLVSDAPDASLRRANGDFELAAMTPRDADRLSPVEKLKLCKQLIHAIENLCIIVAAKAGGLKNPRNGEIDRLQTFLSQESERLLQLLPDFRETRGDPFVRRIQISVAGMAEGLIQNLRKGNLAFDPAATRIHYFKDGEGVALSLSRYLLGFSLIHWLQQHSSQETFLSAGWFLQCRKQEIKSDKEFPVPWPPDPDGDEVLKAWLGILGWKMKVKKRRSEFWITVDFGKAAVHDNRASLSEIDVVENGRDVG